jgi:hypothetical protein
MARQPYEHGVGWQLMKSKSTRVYKFLPAEFALQNLCKRQIKISSFPDMNDPFELLGGLRIAPELRHHWEALLSRLNEWCGVLCFSRGWHNAMLWSHYGDKHKGICLGFDISAKVELRKPCYIANRQEFDEDLRVLVAAASHWMSLKPSDKEFQDCMRIIRRMLLTKFDAWRYEDELRMFIEQKEDQRQGAFYFAEFDEQIQLRSIVLGARCTTPSKHIELVTAGYSPAITVVRAALSPKAFQVTVRR